MSHRVYPEPMPDNPAGGKIGDKSGLWRVVIVNRGSGNIADDNAPKEIDKENIPYQEAFKLSGELERKLNERT